MPLDELRCKQRPIEFILMQLTAMNYYGGKARTDFRKWLLPKIPYDKDGIYVEPFAGMLGVLLARPQCKTEIINDLDANICNWWRVVREHPNELKHLIYYTPKCRRTFYDAMDAVNNRTYKDIPLMWAWATYTVLQFGIAHGIKNTDISIRYTISMDRDFASIIKSLSNRMKNVQVDNTDALTMLDRMKDLCNAVIYCDPPYISANTSHYENDVIDVDAFTDAFLSQKGKVAISGYGDEWEHLGWKRFEWNTKAKKINYVQDYNSEDWNRTEVLWTNYGIGGNQLELEI